MKTVGMITIGQAPRDDVVAGMEKILGPGLRVVQAGALDGLARAEIAALAPRPGQDALTTRLLDGADVIIAKQAVLDRLQGCLDRLEAGVDAFVVLCTGRFPRFRTARPLLEPDRILFAGAQAVHAGGTLGVIIPIVEQQATATARWSLITPDVRVVVASPYRGPEGLVRAAEDLRRAGATLIVLDCMGFTETMKEQVRGIAGAPVLLPSSLIARFAAEVV
jgi:protein AroM